MVNLESLADGFKRGGRVGPATVRDEGGGSAISHTRRVQHHEGCPGRFCGGHDTRQNGAGIAFENEDAPPLDPIKGAVHLTTINEPVLRTMLGLVGMRLWGHLALAL